MHGTAEIDGAITILGMLVLAFAGIRTLVDPRVFLEVTSRVAEGFHRLNEMLSGSSQPFQRIPGSDSPEFDSAVRSARWLGVLLTVLGLAGTLGTLARLS